MRFPARLEDANWFANTHCSHQPDAPITIAHTRPRASQFAALEINNSPKPLSNDSSHYPVPTSIGKKRLRSSPLSLHHSCQSSISRKFREAMMIFSVCPSIYSHPSPVYFHTRDRIRFRSTHRQALHVQPLDTRHPFCASRTAASRSWTLSQATSTRLATEPTLKVKRPSNVVPFS